MEERIVFFGDYDFSYPRERVIKKGLEKNGVKVIECRLHKSVILTGWKKILLLLPACFLLLVKFGRVTKGEPRINALLVPKNNHLLLPLAGFLAKTKRAKLIYDAFDPLYFTAEMWGRRRLRTTLLYILEKVSLKIPDYLLVETQAFAELYSRTFFIPKDRFIIFPPGADEEKFHLSEQVAKSDKFTLLYWGNFHLHHEVETIIRSAYLLRGHEDIQFVLVGRGKEYSKIVAQSKKLGLHNVTFTGRISDAELIQRIESSDVCLGIFSKHRLALCSITNKVCQAMAMGKPVITEESPGTSIFRDREHILKVKPEDPEDLNSKIIILKSDPGLREQLAKKGYEYFQTEFSEEKLGWRIKSVL